MKRRSRRRKGQTIVEYVLIIAIVVVAAIGVLSAFSDTVRAKIVGITEAFGNDQASQSLDKDSKTIFEETGQDYMNQSQ